MVAAGAAGSAAMLNYSRADESDADRFGLRYLTEAGYNPAGLSGAFRNIQELSWGRAGAIPTYLSTHPGITERLSLLDDFAVSSAAWSDILGVFGTNPEVFLRELRDIKAVRMGLDTARVERLLAERAEARARKDFSRADAAREAIASMGVEVRDTPAGPVWDIA